MPFSRDTTVTIIADDKAAPYRKICYVGLVLISLPESHVKVCNIDYKISTSHLDCVHLVAIEENECMYYEIPIMFIIFLTNREERKISTLEKNKSSRLTFVVVCVVITDGRACEPSLVRF